jgi:hypothetical protein
MGKNAYERLEAPTPEIIPNPAIAGNQAYFHKRALNVVGQTAGIGLDLVVDGSGLILNTVGRLVYGIGHVLRNTFGAVTKNERYKTA